MTWLDCHIKPFIALTCQWSYFGFRFTAPSTISPRLSWGITQTSQPSLLLGMSNCSWRTWLTFQEKNKKQKTIIQCSIKSSVPHRAGSPAWELPQCSGAWKGPRLLPWHNLGFGTTLAQADESLSACTTSWAEVLQLFFVFLLLGFQEILYLLFKA